MLTRKDYKAIAGIIFRVENPTNGMIERHELGTGAMITHLADYMVQDNPRFDRDKFITACYGETK